VEFLPEGGKDAAAQEGRDEPTGTTETQSNRLAAGGLGGVAGRENTGRVGAAVQRSSEPDHGLAGTVSGRCGGRIRCPRLVGAGGVDSTGRHDGPLVAVHDGFAWKGTAYYGMVPFNRCVVECGYVYRFLRR